MVLRTIAADNSVRYIPKVNNPKKKIPNKTR